MIFDEDHPVEMINNSYNNTIFVKSNISGLLLNMITYNTKKEKVSIPFKYILLENCSFFNEN